MTQYDTRGAGPPGTQWCALCAAQYMVGVRECVDCLVPLIDAPPLRPEEVGDADGEQLAYEMDDVEASERLAVDRQLAEHGIVHAWEGTTLVVAPWDEEEVDRVLGDPADDGNDPTDPDAALLDEDAEQVVYDLADWDDERRTDLDVQLEAAGIGHAFDENGDLVVLAADEDRVDVMIDAVDNPDQLDAQSDAPDGLDAIETVGGLFVAADRLSHDPTDTDGVVGAADAARALEAMGPPFGFAPALWKELVTEAQQLRALLEADTETVDDEAVVALAKKLRSTLRPYV